MAWCVVKHRDNFTFTKSEMGGHVASMWTMRNTYQILVEKSKGKRTFRILRRGWMKLLK
jgi:hypothetical protein